MVNRDPNDPNGGSSRPIVMFDQGNQDVYVIYTGRFDSTERTISYKVAHLDLSSLEALGESGETHLIGGQGTGISVNNVTSTKQNVDHTTGILVLAKGDDAGRRRLWRTTP